MGELYMQAQRDSLDKGRTRVLHAVSHPFAANARSRQYDGGASAIHVRRTVRMVAMIVYRFQHSICTIHCLNMSAPSIANPGSVAGSPVSL